ncbi:MAG: nucleotidyltransferase family protein [Microcystis sp.]|jgi:hypothetical protein|uniref:nucleotidyltransferase family protein n=1 Tax=Microcystis sp. TaxID=1127 RepID=UPI0039192B62
MKHTSLVLDGESKIAFSILLYGLTGNLNRADLVTEIFPVDLKYIGQRYGLMPWSLAIINILDNSREEFLYYKELSSIAISNQLSAWKKAHTALNAAGIESILFKGLLFSQLLLDSKDCLIFNDVDILIKPSEIETTKRVLREAGFSQNFVSHDGDILLIPDTLIDDFESTHYELFPFTSLCEVNDSQKYINYLKDFEIRHPFIIDNEKLFIAVELDVHHNLSKGIDQEDVWFTPTTHQIDSVSTLGLNPSTLAWFIPARFYHEVMILGAMKTRPLIDLSLLISKEEINWKHVALISEKYSLSASLFYVFSFLSDYGKVRIPNSFMLELSQQIKVQPNYHDFGDFLLKLLRKQILFRPDLLNSGVK